MSEIGAVILTASLGIALALAEVTYAPTNVTIPLLGIRKDAGVLVEPPVSQLCHRFPLQPEELAGWSRNMPSVASNSHAVLSAGPTAEGTEI